MKNQGILQFVIHTFIVYQHSEILNANRMPSSLLALRSSNWLLLPAGLRQWRILSSLIMYLPIAYRLSILELVLNDGWSSRKTNPFSYINAVADAPLYRDTGLHHCPQCTVVMYCVGNVPWTRESAVFSSLCPCVAICYWSLAEWMGKHCCRCQLITAAFTSFSDTSWLASVLLIRLSLLCLV